MRFWARRDWSNPVFGGGGFGDETASGGLGGIQVGCNYQIGQWVLGVQGDWDWISATSSTANIAFPFFTDQSDTKSLASVTGRVGYAWGRFLLYGKGGGAWLRSDFSLQTAGAVFSVSETRSGWTVGVGGEYAFLDWLTGFIEYDHYGFRDDNGVSFGCGAREPCRPKAAGGLELVGLAQGKVILAGSTFRREKMRLDPCTGTSIAAQSRCSS